MLSDVGWAKAQRCPTFKPLTLDVAGKEIMFVSHIESESDYEQATNLLNSLLDVVLDDANHPLYSLVCVVGDLIEAYEIDQEPL